MVKAQICSLLIQWFWTSLLISLNLFLYSWKRYKNITYFAQFLEGQITISKVLPHVYHMEIMFPIKCLLPSSCNDHISFAALFSLGVQSWHLSQLKTIFSKWRDSMDSRIQGIEEPEFKKKVSRWGFLGFVCVGCMCTCLCTHMAVYKHSHIHMCRGQRIACRSWFSAGFMTETLTSWLIDDFGWTLLIVALVMLLTRWTSRSPIYTHRPTETLRSLTFKTNNETADETFQ